ncbi:MAG: glyoxalase/bleomycin resistance/extradiol dioxygenase family protein [Gallicola sp.]|nr:glyoxalase/bleomycin resistance/extradiol dioxygenase family protein [Gallicola sp.]
MAINVYLNFYGNAREVIEYYEDVFETKAEIMSYGDIPEEPDFEITEDMKGAVLHSEMVISDSILMISDDLRGEDHSKKNNFGLAIGFKDEKKLREIFEKIQKEGNVEMQLEKTFWSDLFGIVKDKFGIDWMFNLE